MRRARPPRRMALHVDRDRIHRDVRRGELDVHRERGGVAAESLRSDAEHVDRVGKLVSSFAPSASAQCVPSGRVAAILARCTHRSAVPPTPTPTIVGGQVLPPASSTQSTTKVLIASTPSAGTRHLQPGVVLRAAALGDHLDPQPVDRVAVIDVDHRHADAARRVLVLARQRMHDRRAQRMLARRALAAPANRGLERRAVVSVRTSTPRPIVTL